MATFCAVLVAFYQHYRYQKKEERIENREILQDIIQPLINELGFIIEYYESSGGMGTFDWTGLKKEKSYLILRINSTLRRNIEEFDLDYRKLQNIFRELQPKLIDFLWTRVSDYLRAQSTAESEQTLKDMSGNPKEHIESWQVAIWKIGANKFLVISWKRNQNRWLKIV